MTNYGNTEDKKTCSPDMQRIEERITAVKLSSSLGIKIDRWWYNVFIVTFLLPSRHIHNWKGVWESDNWQKGWDQGYKINDKAFKKVLPCVCANMCVTKGASGQRWAEQKWLLNRNWSRMAIILIIIIIIIVIIIIIIIAVIKIFKILNWINDLHEWILQAAYGAFL